MCTPLVQFEYSMRDSTRNKPTREVNCKIDEALSEHCTYVTGSIILLYPRIKIAIGGRASAWSHTVRQRHGRSQFRAPPMPACRYMEGNGSASILATERFVGGAHMPLPRVNKAAHPGFETQRRCHQKSKTVVSVAPQKGLLFSKN